MTEAFLYYIWQFQYFDKRELETTSGDKITVVNPGILNNNAGPDFFNASLKMDYIAWSGSVEIHTLSSDWQLHGHSADDAYENVVLHVVWEDDKPIHRADGTAMPTLELRYRVAESLVKNYKTLIHNPFYIPCTKSFPDVGPMIKHSMIDIAAAQRLEEKATEVLEILARNNNDWEETTWQLLARNFGFKVNSDAFLQLSKALPYKTILKHADKPVQLEALLFGQAGFLEVSVGDDYYTLLQREYHLLSRKYSLASRRLNRAQWRFLRLRPANFPTVRIAQFGNLLYRQKNLFSSITDALGPKELRQLFAVQQSDYWIHHYRFNKKSKGLVPELGPGSVENILINTAVPLLAAWGKLRDEPRFVDRAVDLLQFLPAEDNAILREWKALNFTPGNAFDSQGLITLYNYYCRRRICLNCVIGAALLKPGTE